MVHLKSVQCHLTAGSCPSQSLDCSPLLVTVFHKLISDTVQGITVTTQQHAATNTMRSNLHASIQVAITPDHKDTIGTKAQTAHSLHPHTAAKYTYMKKQDNCIAAAHWSSTPQTLNQHDQQQVCSIMTS